MTDRQTDSNTYLELRTRGVVGVIARLLEFRETVPELVRLGGPARSRSIDSLFALLSTS